MIVSTYYPIYPPMDNVHRWIDNSVFFLAHCCLIDMIDEVALETENIQKYSVENYIVVFVCLFVCLFFRHSTSLYVNLSPVVSVILRR